MKIKKSIILLAVIVAVFAVGAKEASAMKQLIIGGTSDALNNAAAEYNTLGGGTTWNGTANNRKQVAASGGTLSNFAVELSAAPGGGGSYTIRILNVTQATTLDVTITDAATTGINTGSLSVSAGDVIQIDSSDSGASATPAARWSVIFTGTTASESLLLTTNTPSLTANRYFPIQQGGPNGDATASSTLQVIPTSGTIKNLYVALSTDPGTAPDAYQFTLWKNGAATALTTTITADATTGNDTSNTVSVSAGDQVYIEAVPLSAPANGPIAWVGMTFVAAIDGESLILGDSSDLPTASATEYNHLSTTAYNIAWNATESNVYQDGHNTQTVTLRKFYAALSAAPTNPMTFTVKQAAGDTTITCAISSLTCNDTTHTATVASYDELSMKVVTGAGTTRITGWGLVGYIAPAGGGPTGIGVKAFIRNIKMIIMGGKMIIR